MWQPDAKGHPQKDLEATTTNAQNKCTETIKH